MRIRAGYYAHPAATKKAEKTNKITQISHEHQRREKPVTTHPDDAAVLEVAFTRVLWGFCLKYYTKCYTKSLNSISVH